MVLKSWAWLSCWSIACGLSTHRSFLLYSSETAPCCCYLQSHMLPSFCLHLYVILERARCVGTASPDWQGGKKNTNKWRCQNRQLSFVGAESSHPLHPLISLTLMRPNYKSVTGDVDSCWRRLTTVFILCFDYDSNWIPSEDHSLLIAASLAGCLCLARLFVMAGKWRRCETQSARLFIISLRTEQHQTSIEVFKDIVIAVL